MNKEL
jgi:hypothetical protein